MKPIKITDDNAIAIEDALKAVNGTARKHAYTEGYEIGSLAEAAEKQLEALGLPKDQRAGATWRETSGGPVLNAYDKKGHMRQATRVTLERRSTGWFLADVAKVQIGKAGGGAGRLVLLPEQATEAVRRFRMAFDTVQSLA